MDTLLVAYNNTSSYVFETLVQPFLYWMGWSGWVEEAYAVNDWFIFGLLQLLCMVILFTPLEKCIPVEKNQQPNEIKVDVIYTLIHRLGLFRLCFFLMFGGFIDYAWGFLRVKGVPTLQLDALIPWNDAYPLVGFLVYLIVFDFIGYWVHRAQHQWNWWWALHSVHHSQRSMTYWSDSRNHLLDDVFLALIAVFLSQLFGLAPSQFVLLMALTQMSQSLQHANARLPFGRVLERIWVSPRFHRMHHSIGTGHEFEKGILGGCNFGVLLPCWDVLFGTANFDHRYEPTGIRDQIESAKDYGVGFWAQQRLGLQRFIKSL